mgnify:CR=1 FL=1|jgi:hypothetical protein
MTFEEYLKDIYGDDYRGLDDDMPDRFDQWLTDLQVDEIIIYAQCWHTQELKSMRTKGANTTNSKYSKEERSEWAKKGGRPRKPVDNSLTK